MSALPDMSGPVNGGVGMLLGAVLTWAGFKSRLDSQDEKIRRLESETASKTMCEERGKGCTSHFERMEEIQDEMRSDIKILLQSVERRGQVR